uniref:Uncharacterized protein n=1 Tax=Pseudomonas aeruginosa TaxID=287 RepID=A0A894X9X5_PSEAI|nr:hypothetical protein [Pseudomonas aeruginosa]
MFDSKARSCGPCSPKRWRINAASSWSRIRACTSWPSAASADPMVARRPSPMPPAATRMSMASTTGGNWRVPSSAAMTLASSSIRRRACLRASCAARTTSTCPLPRHTCRCRRFLPRPAVTDRPSLAPAPGASFFPAMWTAASADCRSPARHPGATLPAMFR